MPTSFWCASTSTHNVASIAAGSLLAEIPERELRWMPAFRLLASRFPPIELFERVAGAQDWEALFALESLTNPRLREQAGNISLVPPQDRVSGPGASVIMAPFTHLNPDGSRFADAHCGALYAADTLETAIAETRHHREIFLRATQQPATEVEMRCYLLDIAGKFRDLRGADARFAEVMSPTSYVASQALARDFRAAGANGVCYDSVRRHGGQCIALFKPRLASHVRQSRHLRYVWNAERINAVYELRLLDT